jgi:uncharacterized membrane protein
MLVLSGVLVIIIGFAVRANPLLVIAAAGLASGLAAGLSPYAIVATFGHAFGANRFITAVWIMLALIGVLEREGLQARARQMVAAVEGATAGRLLLVYLIFRQVTSALGLAAVGGQAQMVRPLIAPMAERAGETREPISDATRQRIRAMAAATDNIGFFFGEDVFIAIGSILLIKGFLEQAGYVVEPLHVALWAIPTALMALAVHGTRLLLFDRRLRRLAARDEEQAL